MEWVGRLGGADVGTLPLLAAFLDEPIEISPYRPVSRLFWNELFVDVEVIPELQDCPECRHLIASDGFRRRVEEHRNSELVDYREVMRLKREVLEPLSANIFRDPPGRFGDLQRFVRENPAVEDYARFRAVCERQRDSWPSWPGRMKDDCVDNGDYDPLAANYHLYVQWIAHEQLAASGKRGTGGNSGTQGSTAGASGTHADGCKLYLDLPIGVDPRGYDVWRHRELFAVGASVGSPPDVVFPKGQDWGLPPHGARAHSRRRLRLVSARDGDELQVRRPAADRSCAGVSSAVLHSAGIWRGPGRLRSLQRRRAVCGGDP